MKVRSFKNRDYSNGWVQTAVSILGLVFSILVAFGVITPEQSTQGLPIATSTVTAISTVIAGIVALIGIFFKPSK
jgi:uncharacterized membrane protein HdeD (DUF308 family)